MKIFHFVQGGVSQLTWSKIEKEKKIKETRRSEKVLPIVLAIVCA